MLLHIYLCLSEHVRLASEGHKLLDCDSPSLLTPLPCLTCYTAQKETHISMSVTVAQGTGLFGNFNLWLPLCSLQKDLIIKWPEFHTLAYKEASSSPISIQHTESSLCFYDQIKSVLMFLFLWVYFPSRYEDLKYQGSAVCLQFLCFSK